MNPETQHVIEVLKDAIGAAELHNRDVERTLKLSSSYLSRLFSGTIELRFEHIVKIARAVGLEPAEIVHALYPVPKDPPSEAMVRLQEALRHLKPPPPPGWTPEARATFERHLERALLRVLRRVRLSLAPPPAPEPPPDS
jgi:transcriptional regulator with XRE-family HTH domain